MKLIVGLGNPGFRYKNTRHNIGFMVINELSKRCGMPVKKKKYNGLFTKGAIEGRPAGFFMPETYMNLSGEAVLRAVKREKVDSKDFLIVCDDINLKFGSMRLREKGSAGGHNGLESIIGSLGTDEFPRLRIGIGKDSAIRDVVKFVLRPFDASERPNLAGIIKDAADCAVLWMMEGAAQAMAKFNRSC